jgi:hypothetical protein
VSLRLSLVSMSSRKRLFGDLGESRSTITRDLPSGDQEIPQKTFDCSGRGGPQFADERASSRSFPPPAGISRISAPSGRLRTKAIRNPSGDHTGE